MYDGDMWDNGRGYLGPVPIDADSYYTEILYNIKRTFVGRNVVQEVVDRQVDALLSKSPDWKIYDKTLLKQGKKLATVTKPAATDNADDNSEIVSNPKIEEAEMLISEVWNRAKLGEVLKEAMTNRLVKGRGILRVYLAKTFIDNQDSIKDFYEISKHIKVECVDESRATILDEDGEQLSIIQLTKKGSQVKMLEVSFVGPDNKTYIGTIDSSVSVTDNENEEVAEAIAKVTKVAKLSSPVSMQGYITSNEIVGRPFVSETILQNNRALNLALSLAAGVLVESGYAEMVMTNVSMETRQIDDPESPGKKKNVPVGLKRGPGVVNNLLGEQSVTAEGEVKYQQPDVYFKEPSPLKSFVDGEALYYRQILAEAHQTHVLIVGDAKASGESRIQARQGFVKKSQRYKPSLDIQGSWLVTAILGLAASAIEKDGHFDDLGVLFDSKIYAGELSSDEQNIVISRFEKSLISRETAIVLLGSEEPLLEIEKIKLDDAEKLKLQVERLEATAKFGNMLSNGAPTTEERQAKRDEQNNQ